MTQLKERQTMINQLTGRPVETRTEIIDVFSCCDRHVYETPQGTFDRETKKIHVHDGRLPDDLAY